MLLTLTKGRFYINVYSTLSPEERLFLKEKYSHLSRGQLKELEDKISHIQFSEMVPYYIMRYGFYEGHTVWRSDPIVIAFIFGMKSLEEIEKTFKGNLYKTLTNHFTQAK